MKIEASHECSHCLASPIEPLLKHIFMECPRTQNFYKMVVNFIKINLNNDFNGGKLYQFTCCHENIAQLFITFNDTHHRERFHVVEWSPRGDTIMFISSNSLLFWAKMNSNSFICHGMTESFKISCIWSFTGHIWSLWNYRWCHILCSWDIRWFIPNE